jgi:hypothetical protein
VLTAHSPSWISTRMTTLAARGEDIGILGPLEVSRVVSVKRLLVNAREALGCTSMFSRPATGTNCPLERPRHLDEPVLRTAITPLADPDRSGEGTIGARCSTDGLGHRTSRATETRTNYRDT